MILGDGRGYIMLFWLDEIYKNMIKIMKKGSKVCNYQKCYVGRGLHPNMSCMRRI